MQVEDYLDVLEVLQYALLGEDKNTKDQYEKGVSLEVLSKQIKHRIDTTEAMSDLGFVSDPLNMQIYVEAQRRLTVLEKVLLNYESNGEHGLENIEMSS